MFCQGRYKNVSFYTPCCVCIHTSTVPIRQPTNAGRPPYRHCTRTPGPFNQSSDYCLCVGMASEPNNNHFNNSRSVNGSTVTVESLSQSLQPYLLSSTMETGEIIGRGAYGTVYKVRRWGTICAAKKLHEFPLQVQKGGGSIKNSSSTTGLSSSNAEQSEKTASSKGQHSSVGRKTSQQSLMSVGSASSSSSSSSAAAVGGSASMMAKFEKECHLLSNLRHPYIVQFLGVYIEKASGAPVIVMEYLPTSLAACVQTKPNIPRYLQISMLHNVALGLAYLHGHSPPIIHRDLTANNVLLTSNMVAKIADLGVARILDLTPKRAMQLTQAPGTAAYMPPEALAQNPCYNTRIDSFSFGVLVLHLVSQMWPIPTEPVKVTAGGKLAPVSELERRHQQIELMGREHCLFKLTSECLQNDSTQRPETSQIVVTLEALQSKFPLPSTSYLDLLQVGSEFKHINFQFTCYIVDVFSSDPCVSSCVCVCVCVCVKYFK